MKRIMTLKGVIALTAVALLLAGGAAYATQVVFDVILKGNVQVAIISTTDPIQVFDSNLLPIPRTSGGSIVDTIDFGVVEPDYFGRDPVPVSGPFFVKNVSHGPVQVVVTGDLRDNIVPLWGPTLADLKPAPDNAFRLEAPGISGDTMTGYLGLRFLNISGGTKQTTIIFRAREIGVPTGASRIAFTSNKGGYRAISVMDADGSNLTRLTPLGSYTNDPAWSPDGAKIAFSFNNRVYVMDSDGSNQTGLSGTISVIGTGDGVTGDVIVPAFGDSPAWSPDGSKIAFASNRHGNSGIFVMNSDGSNQTRLGDTVPGVTGDVIVSGFGNSPAWSPDGSKIAFRSSRLPGGISVINADGSNETRLITGDNYDPDWSPDGGKIVFQSYRDGQSEIYVMTSTGGNQTNLTRNIASDSSPAWSPDGSKIAFISNRDGNAEIYIMSGDGSNQTRVTKTPDSESYPDWSPGAVSAIIVPAAAMTLDQGSDEFGAGGVGTGAYPTEPFDPRPERR